MPRYAELKREHKKAGCYFKREGANHEIWYSPITGREFPMSRHNGEEVPKGTEMAIRKQSGVYKK